MSSLVSDICSFPTFDGKPYPERKLMTCFPLIKVPEFK
nr:MAG TPA: hypothetical protein [Caudoviricetes sp.]